MVLPMWRFIYMQSGNPQKHMIAFGYQIFGFEVEG